MERKNTGKETAKGGRKTNPPSFNHHTDHRKGDRRKCAGKGYTYITMVGWMCRREKVRRNQDKF